MRQTSRYQYHRLHWKKNVLFSLLIIFNLIKEVIISSKFKPRHLAGQIVDALYRSATQCETRMNSKFLDIEIRLKCRYKRILSILTCKEPVMKFQKNASEKGSIIYSHSFYRSKRSKLLIYRITWKDIAIFFSLWFHLGRIGQ